MILDFISDTDPKRQVSIQILVVRKRLPFPFKPLHHLQSLSDSLRMFAVVVESESERRDHTPGTGHVSMRSKDSLFAEK